MSDPSEIREWKIRAVEVTAEKGKLVTALEAKRAAELVNLIAMVSYGEKDVGESCR